MCFSAAASFIASATLIGVGGYSLKIATPREKYLAAIPLLFGIQQGIEGLIWLQLNQGSASTALGYLYLFFAIALWPMYVPVAIYILEKKKRFISGLLVILGVIVSSALVVNHIGNPLTIKIVENSISYQATATFSGGMYDQLAAILNYGYVFVVIMSFLALRQRFFHIFAAVMFVAAVAAYFLYNATYISTWCFFAAVVSVGIVGYLKRT